MCVQCKSIIKHTPLFSLVVFDLHPGPTVELLPLYLPRSPLFFVKRYQRNLSSIEAQVFIAGVLSALLNEDTKERERERAKLKLFSSYDCGGG